jgi:hypothetical protein
MGDFAGATHMARSYVERMTTRADTRERRASAAPSSNRREPAALALIVVPFLFALTLLTFAWPSARLGPRDLPLGVAGPDEAARRIEHRLTQAESAFELHRYADERDARAAIEDRDIYGAVVASGDGLMLLTSSAASPLVASLLEQRLGTEGAASTSVRTDDVVPADSDDPRGSVLSSLVLPLVLSSVVAAAIVSLLGSPGIRQAGILLVASVLAGLVGIAMVQSWLGAFGGSWLVNAGVLSLTMLAIAALLAGLAAFLGHAGLALGGLTMVLVGNPWSGVSSAPELLPKPIGLIGQLLPPGAGGNLLRSTAFFDDAGAAGPLTVLLVSAVLGLVAIWAGALLHRRRTVTTSATLDLALSDAGSRSID